MTERSSRLGREGEIMERRENVQKSRERWGRERGERDPEK